MRDQLQPGSTAGVPRGLKPCSSRSLYGEGKITSSKFVLRFLVATITLFTSLTSRAQISNPDKLVGHAPANPARTQRAARTMDYQWLWQFTKPEPGGRAYDLRVDGRFQSLLASAFKQPQAMWGAESAHLPLPTVIPLFLSQHGVVNKEANRYITVDGCVQRFCPAHGMLWVDLGTPHPLMVFAAEVWTTEGHTTDETSADYNLWLFPNRSVDANALPLALAQSISHWDARLASAHRGVAHVGHAILVEPSGEPFPVDPALAGANTLQPQPDTVTPKEPEID